MNILNNAVKRQVLRIQVQKSVSKVEEEESLSKRVKRIYLQACVLSN